MALRCRLVMLGELEGKLPPWLGSHDAGFGRSTDGQSIYSSPKGLKTQPRARQKIKELQDGGRPSRDSLPQGSLKEPMG